MRFFCPGWSIDDDLPVRLSLTLRHPYHCVITCCNVEKPILTSLIILPRVRYAKLYQEKPVKHETVYSIYECRSSWITWCSSTINWQANPIIVSRAQKLSKLSSGPFHVNIPLWSIHPRNFKEQVVVEVSKRLIHSLCVYLWFMFEQLWIFLTHSFKPPFYQSLANCFVPATCY
jgi:hypothetical protein